MKRLLFFSTLLTVTTADGRQITLRLMKQSDIFSR